ncbi:MAG: cytochrome-c oxidase, cbb3-type subunit I [Phycisphaeraceae bacterium]|nr:cytochrome-c oxidase, cbb3-type subunit I [Phycisphaerae bacterium]MBX3393210.1 cytochrome-c oxidase, cbb3-type subunit I [Phycisphaeraceae bacterium]
MKHGSDGGSSAGSWGGHGPGPSGGVEARGRLESFVYDDDIVRKFLVATIVWGMVAFLAGLLIAFQLALPRLNFGVEYLGFGRLRPLHTNAAIFAFAGNAIFTAVYYSTQRLCKARMFSDTLSRLHFWGWQLIIVGAALTLPLGITSGKEYAELEWPIDLMIAVVWLGFFGTNFLMTLLRRRERHMYVALWFYIASIVTVTVLHVFNSLALPVGLFKSYSVYAGVQDAFMQWWYGHNAVAFFLTTPFLGLMYYFLPKAAGRPVFSYRLSIVHFWSLVFLYIWAGPHHLHYTALPGWASSLGMVFSVMLWMPSWGGGINGLLTLRGAWHKLRDDPVLKFFVAGVTFYMMSTFEGPMLSVKSVNALSHYTDWTIAHVHAGALGWNGLMTFGMIYWLLPRLFQADLYSRKLAEWHFWIGTMGILLYVIPIYAGGITQGLMWRAFDESGSLQFPDFVETVMALMPFYWLRIIGGTLFIAGMALLIYNALMTWRNRPPRYEEPVHQAPALSAAYDDGPEPASSLEANTEFARKFEARVLQGWFHRVWERKPLRFTVMTTLAVLLASALEIIPTFLIRSNVPTIASVKPYTPLELAGRDIYIAEGCYNCHSQMIRPLWHETRRYGEYSKPGEFVYDHPFQWGSRRIGPDLAREGGARSHDWHVRHFEDPRQMVGQSIMPSYAHLLAQDLDFDGIGGRVRAMAMLGVPYGEAVRDGRAAAMAREQAGVIAAELESQGGYPGMAGKKVIALVAYMQRLGKDISESVTPQAPAATGE